MLGRGTLYAAIILACAHVPVLAQGSGRDPYVSCSFYPQGRDCDRIYKRSLKETSPMALSVREAFDRYARYLQDQTATLTEADRRYLKDNDIKLPFELNSRNSAGLHNVINDPELREERARRTAVNNFIARAVQAELYCGTGVCAPADG